MARMHPTPCERRWAGRRLILPEKTPHVTGDNRKVTNRLAAIVAPAVGSEYVAPHDLRSLRCPYRPRRRDLVPPRAHGSVAADYPGTASRRPIRGNRARRLNRHALRER